MNRGQLPTNQLVHDINWSVLDHASLTYAPQLILCKYYVCMHVCMCMYVNCVCMHTNV